MSLVKEPKVGFLSSGDATFRLLAKILRYVNIVAQHVNIVAQPLPPKPAGTNCRAVSRASRPAFAAEARRNELPSGVYASRLMTQKRLRLARPALRQVALSALGSYRPPSPCGSRNAFNRRRKAWRRLAFHAQCVSPTSPLAIATPALRLTKSYRLP